MRGGDRYSALRGTLSEKTIVVVPDFQAPYHHRKTIDTFIKFIGDYQPDVLVNVGDDVDSPEVSYWSKGKAGEYAGTLQKGFDATRSLHGRFRKAIGDRPYHVSRSNHGDRLAKYIRQYAPALVPLKSLDLRELLGYNDYGITYHTQPFTIAPGWLCAHGDEGHLSKYAGGTASALSAKWATSVVCGHTHRAGIVPTTRGAHGSLSTQWGMEVGHMMDIKQAGYLKGGHANWQRAFGILHVRGTRVQPELIYIQSDSTFRVDGVWYGVKPVVRLEPEPQAETVRAAMDRLFPVTEWAA